MPRKIDESKLNNFVTAFFLLQGLKESNKTYKEKFLNSKKNHQGNKYSIKEAEDFCEIHDQIVGFNEKIEENEKALDALAQEFIPFLGAIKPKPLEFHFSEGGRNVYLTLSKDDKIEVSEVH